jgi:hypothetical protein
LNIEQFMQGYKAAWEQRDEALFAALFTADGQYHNTPFAVQRGHAQLAEYWLRVKLQEDVRVTYEVLASTPGSGIVVARTPGAPLPRMVLDGLLTAEFEGGLCKECHLWWHSMPLAS